MKLENEILINKFAQGILNIEILLNNFIILDIKEKKEYLNYLVILITQSKVEFNDVKLAILNSKLKPTFTPCVLIEKGIEKQNLLKIINLPENELQKVLILFLELFKIGYLRRYEIEKNSPSKWWFWDFSDYNNLLKLKAMIKSSK